jgi:hypothetical protein
VRAFRLHARRSENSYARTDEVKHAKAAKEIANHSQKRDQFIQSRAWSFEKNFIGALRRRGQGRTGDFRILADGTIAPDKMKN